MGNVTVLDCSLCLCRVRFSFGRCYAKCYSVRVQLVIVHCEVSVVRCYVKYYSVSVQLVIVQGEVYCRAVLCDML
jgi:hypothetical protein